MAAMWRVPTTMCPGLALRESSYLTSSGLRIRFAPGRELLDGVYALVGDTFRFSPPDLKPPSAPWASPLSHRSGALKGLFA
jgi:hypothetical protein